MTLLPSAPGPPAPVRTGGDALGAAVETTDGPIRSTWKAGQVLRYVATLESQRFHDSGTQSVTEITRIRIHDRLEIQTVAANGNAEARYGLERIELFKSDGQNHDYYEISERNGTEGLPFLPDVWAYANLVGRNIPVVITPELELLSAEGFDDGMAEAFRDAPDTQFGEPSPHIYSDDWFARTKTKLWALYGASRAVPVTEPWSQPLRALPMRKGLPYFWKDRATAVLVYQLDRERSDASRTVFDVRASFDPPDKRESWMGYLKVALDCVDGRGEVHYRPDEGIFSRMEFRATFRYQQIIPRDAGPSGLVLGSMSLLYHRQLAETAEGAPGE